MSLVSSCIVCGRVIPLRQSRCGLHPYRSGRSGQKPRSHGERMRRKAVVDAWRREHGEICPGFGVPAHSVVTPNFWTADHVDPVSLGGDPAGELRALCNRCNVRRGGRNRLLDRP